MTTDMTVQLLIQMKDLASKGLENLGKTGETAGKRLGDAGKQASGAFGGIQSSVTSANRALAAFGVGLSIAAVISQVKQTLTYFDDLKVRADQARISIASLASLESVGAKSGLQSGDINNVLKGLDQFTQRIVQGVPEATLALSEMARATGDNSFEMQNFLDLKPDERFLKIIGAFEGMTESQETSITAMRVFGKSYDDVRGAIDRGEASWRNLSKQYQENHKGLEETTKRLSEVHDQLAATGAEVRLFFGEGMLKASEGMDALGASIGRSYSKLEAWVNKIREAQGFTGTIGSVLGTGTGAADESITKKSLITGLDIAKDGVNKFSQDAIAQLNALDGKVPDVMNNLGDALADFGKKLQESGVKAKGFTPGIIPDEEGAQEAVAVANSAQSEITAFIASEQEKRNALSLAGIQANAEIEIAEWKKALDSKLIKADQFEQAVLFIRENATAAGIALIAKAAEEENKKKLAAFKAFMELELTAQKEQDEKLKAAADKRAQDAGRAADLYETTTVAGIQRALNAEIAALEASGAKYEEIAAAKVAVTAQAAEQIAAINLASAEQSNNVLAGMAQGITDWKTELGTGFTQARDFTKSAITSMQGGLSDMIVSAQNSSDGVGAAFASMAQSVAAAIQKMIADMIAQMIMQQLLGLAGSVSTSAFSGLFDSTAGVGSMGAGSDPGFNYGGFQASGTAAARGGLTWVGERGPELIQMPRGTTVASSHQMMGGGDAAAPTIVQLTINAVDARSVAQLLMQPESQNTLKETFRSALQRDKGTRNAARGV